MKKTIMILCALLITVSVSAQKKKRNAKVSIEVDGVCMMCKKRIEVAALKTKGVKFANWNVRTHQLNLIIDERKTDTLKIQKKMASVGHDTKAIKAKLEVYNAIDPCCKYRDEKVVKDHIKQ
jgi:periplasmic mercuric ion binding protein